ncbi:MULTISPECIES: zinc piracy TonB-dependent receptor ZnuD [Acinetobacter]|uniref:zinc piracy TonB-dependent receptor ZnuD n=1 Tax=Acinetobacter TaxID=469 RepID=UPI000C3EFB85|nr:MULTISPECIES: zinc piracy TonB-dependent receptor ZnuD [Acinetobacter]MBC67550.1 TonB-dependent receptor [Acinetobacter sp.]MBT49032.1 TonB-dependent receptor [Acinetobacter sp.]HIQ36012.1 TonB-dependent receptor [Acinetobacter venetianus]HJP47163.1 zinc piracy TonB-dependent receptor ZnuD [Acinetobacter venetianus]
MSFPQNILTLSILAVVALPTFAAENEEVQTLETIRIKAHPLEQTSKDFAVADTVVDQKRLAQGAVTIGEALSGESGIASNQFGAGSSRPVIRGQDGPRVKILQNSSENIDVSTLSPDHAVTVDPALAKQVEVIRGPSTLLFGAGTVGGLVNVNDSKLPTQMPEKGYEGNVGLRYNTGSDEKLATAGVTVGLGDQVALRVEGLKREANDYIAPNYFHEGEKERRVDNTFAEGQTVNVGLSWIYDRGFTGISYSNRQDKYGLPGHSHEYESCDAHLSGRPHLHCGDHDHDHGDEDDHDHEEHAHDAGPWIDLKSERYDFRTELDDPFVGFKKLRAQASYTDYQHDEIEEDTIATRFKNKGYDGRLELVHNPIGPWEGVIGTQYNQQKLELTGEEAFLAPNTTKKWSVFGLEHAQFNDVHVELAARADQQKIDIEDSSKKNFDGSAFSVSGAANWEFAPDYKLSFVASHQERLPLAQELYADGGHFATNTYELGNDQLGKEKSNNVELGFHFDNDKFDYHVHVYHNWFDDYIYAQTLDRYKDFRLVQYTQDKARFYGAEAEANYQVSSIYKLGVFGDYVRGKIDNENAPRVPAGRLGTKVNADFGDGFSGSAEYYHVFQQDKIAAYETDTQSYNMLNLGVAYSGQYSNVGDYRVFLNANNLLDDQVYQHASFLSTIPQVGRNFTVGVNFSF